MSYYIKFTTTGGGTFNMPIFAVQGDSVTIRPVELTGNVSYEQYEAAVLENTGLRLSDALFIPDKNSADKYTNPNTRATLQYFNFVWPFDFIGQTWVSGGLKIVWTGGDGHIYGDIYGGTRLIGRYETYYSTTNYGPRLTCPFVYSISTGKIILMGDMNNQVYIDTINRWLYHTYARSHTYSINDSESRAINENGEVIVNPTSTDPYQEIPESEHGGGGGSFTFGSGDPVLTPQLPTLSATSTGFVSLWAPTEEQMLDLSAFMWNADYTTYEFWKKLIADPIKLIYGLNIIPLNLRDSSYDIIGDPMTMCVGFIDTGIEMDTLTRQWVELDCGTIDIDEIWGAYLDYDPFTKMEIYLPYCGTHPLRADDFMGGKIGLKYHIDLLSGACIAMISSERTDDFGELNSVMYQFMGNCATQIPVSGDQYADAVRAVVTIAAAIGTMVALGGAAGAGGAAAEGELALPAAEGATAGEGASHIAGYLTAGAGAGTAAGAAAEAASSSKAISTLYQVAQMRAASAAVTNVMGMKPQIERSGAIGAAGGLLAVQKPYIIITRPNQAQPKDQNVYTGYPSFITRSLSELSGFTQMQAIHLENLPCTATELAEIDALLKSGVIF